MSQSFRDAKGVDHTFPDDATPEEMAAAVEGRSGPPLIMAAAHLGGRFFPGPTAPEQEALQANPMSAGGHRPQNVHQAIAELLGSVPAFAGDVTNLPMILPGARAAEMGATSAASLQPWARAARAGAAANVGFGIPDRASRGRLPGVADVATDAATGAALGPATEAAMAPMRALQPRAGRLASRFMGEALNPGEPIIAEGRSVGPTPAQDRSLIDSALRQGVPRGGMDTPGANEITRRLRASHAAEDEIAAESSAASKWRLSPSQVLKEMEQQALAKTARNKSKTVIDSPEWQARAKDFLDSFSDPAPSHMPAVTRGSERPFDVFAALQEKRAADAASFSARQQVKNGQMRPTNQGIDVDEMFDKLRGDVLRQHLRDNFRDVGLGRQMQKTSELMPLEHAYMKAESRNSGLGEGGVVKNLVRAAVSPQAQSRRAISLYRLSKATPDATALARGIPYLGRSTPLDAERRR